VLDFYDDVDSRRGNDRNANVSRGQLDPLLRQFRGVDDDDEDLLAFLGASSDGSFDRTTPRRVPSGPCQAISNGYRAALRRAINRVTED